MASGDQLGFSLQATDNFWDAVVSHAKAQGRVYFLFTKIIDLGLAARPEHWRTLTINLLVYALSPVCFAYAVCENAAQRWLYVWLFLGFAWLGYHHLPPSAYPTVNHLAFPLWALAAFLVRQQGCQGDAGGWKLPSAFGVISYAALFQYEAVTCMSLPILGWLIYTQSTGRRRRQLAIAGAAAAALYGATYIAWRLRFPTSYGGAMLGPFSPSDLARVTSAYAIGSLPFSAAYRQGWPITFGDAQIGVAGLPFDLPGGAGLGLLGVLLSAWGAAGMLRMYRLTPSAPLGAGSRWAAWLLGGSLLIAINGPLGLSVKYRQWVTGWDDTYLTSQLAFYPLVFAATLALDTAYRRLRFRGWPLLFGMAAVTLTALSVPVRAHNVQVAARQRAGLARWDGMAALAAYADRIPQRDLVAPDLFYTVFAGEPNWGGYWQRYFRQRFGGDFIFHDRPPPGRAYALLRLHRFDDGRLSALSIRTPDYLAVVARPSNMPALLVSGERGVPVDWQHAEKLGGSGYVSVTLTDPASLLETSAPFELVWLVPSSRLATPR
jgi:hypothetical protein